MDVLLMRAAGALALPQAARLARVTLVVWREQFQAARGAGRRLRVHGLFDPTLSRIELFGCGADAGDADLVRVLAHELAHAAGIADEREAQTWADRAIGTLEESVIVELAGGLRARARNRFTSQFATPHSCSPLGLGV